MSVDAKKIDYDRGLMKRLHKATGVNVFMYFDEPGLYRTAHGTFVSEKFADQAGFDVKELAKQRTKKELVAAAMAKIDVEVALAGPKREVIKTNGNLSVVDIGVGRFNVEDEDRNVLNNVALSREMALKLLDNLAPEEVPSSDTTA